MAGEIKKIGNLTECSVCPDKKCVTTAVFPQVRYIGPAGASYSEIIRNGSQDFRITIENCPIRATAKS